MGIPRSSRESSDRRVIGHPTVQPSGPLPTDLVAPPPNPRLVSLPRLCGIDGQRIFIEGRTSRRDFGRLRSSTCSKLLHKGRPRRRLVSATLAEGPPKVKQASQSRRHRTRLLTYESAPSIGTETVTDKNLPPSPAPPKKSTTDYTDSTDERDEECFAQTRRGAVNMRKDEEISLPSFRSLGLSSLCASAPLRDLFL